jgi:hypothetical protein
VAVLHELGIVPGPRAEERVLVGDLGLAKALAHGSGFTIIAGSPGYMAPEQARFGGGLDARADVYALGALTYHMLTGRTPSVPASVQAVAAAAALPVVRPSKVRSDVPSSVDGVVLRALQAEPRRRWPSAAAFADALEAAAVPSVRRSMRASRLAAGSVLVTAAVLAATAADAGPPPADPVWVRVTDASGHISVAVPEAWAGQVRDSGWNPQSIRLPAGTAPGLVVGLDLAAWSDAASAVPGVFVGASRALRTSTPALPDHSACVPEPGRQYDLGPGTVSVRRWTRCGGTGISFTEALMTPPTGGYGLYVQIRQVDETDRTEEILRGVRTSDRLASTA